MALRARGRKCTSDLYGFSFCQATQLSLMKSTLSQPVKHQTFFQLPNLHVWREICWLPTILVSNSNALQGCLKNVKDVVVKDLSLHCTIAIFGVATLPRIWPSNCRNCGSSSGGHYRDTQHIYTFGKKKGRSRLKESALLPLFFSLLSKKKDKIQLLLQAWQRTSTAAECQSALL